jgi:ligand-binding sensor domain-containing protein/serine phosphatase RsbU (regulator of sigma subunit)
LIFEILAATALASQAPHLLGSMTQRSIYLSKRRKQYKVQCRLLLSAFVCAGVFLLILIGGTIPSAAQNLLFEHFSYEQGLSESNVTAILQDRYGFLWVGTSNGLNRYDGYKMTTFRNDPNDSSSLSSNVITALYEDESGALWVGTQDGLNRLDHTTGRFSAYKNTPDNTNSLSNNFIRALAEVPRGVLWVATKRGLNRFDMERNEWKFYKADKKGRGKGPSDNDITAMLVEPSNRAHLWLAARGGGLNLLHISKGIFKVFKPEEFEEYDEMNIGVSAMTFDAANTLWLATRDNSLWRFFPEEKRFSRVPDILPSEQAFSQYLTTITPQRAIPTITVQSLAIDKQGTLWAGAREGLFSRPTTNDDVAWEAHKNNPNDAQSLSDNNVTVMLQDHAGVMWFGTQEGGLNKFVPQTAAFRNVKYSPDTKALPNPLVNAIARKASGEEWFGTQNGAVIYQNGLPKRVVANGYVVTAILHDKQGNTWLGTESGVLEFDAGGLPKRLQGGLQEMNGLSDNIITALAEDKAGNIWIGTQGDGVSLFNPRSGILRRFFSDADDTTSLSENFVFSITVSRTGTVWIGTNSGLNRFDAAKEQFRRITRTTKSGFPDVPILALYEDAEGALWLGTLGGGLFRYNPASEAVQRFSKKDKLPSETIFGILSDNAGKIWLSTSRGLAALRLNKNAGGGTIQAVRSYGASDGLQSSTFRKGAYFRAADGMMMFGLGTGFVRFHPDSLHDNRLAPPIAVTRFQLFNDDGINDNLLLQQQTQFEINYNDNFELEYAALDFTNPERNQYAHRMEGFTKDWLYTDQGRKITGTNLDPGTYTLYIKAANSDGIWSETPLELTIVVRPPWWGTWWFRLIFVAVGIGCIVLAYRLRVRSMVMMNSRLQTLVEARTKEISEQASLLEEQASEIQMANGALQEKNVELERVLHVSEMARQELEHAYKLLDSENTRKTQELSEARAFQLSMLPRNVPQIQGLDVAFALRTATEVGGDYYDYVQTAEGALTLAIGDATGHGVRAGMLVSLVKSSFHALVHDYPLSETVAMISQTIKQMRLQRMFMCFSVLHFRRLAEEQSSKSAWALDVAGAGMPPMMIYRAATGTMEFFRTQGIVLGAMENASYPASTLHLAHGDRLLIMSDGIIELFNSAGEELGTERVKSCFQRHCTGTESLSADELLGELHRLIDAWLDGEAPNDDIALVVVRVV